MDCSHDDASYHRHCMALGKRADRTFRNNIPVWLLGIPIRIDIAKSGDRTPAARSGRSAEAITRIATLLNTSKSDDKEESLN